MALELLSRSRNHIRQAAPAVAANSTNSSEAFDVSTWDQGTFQVVHAAHSDTSSWKLQGSNNGGSNWDDISGQSGTTISAAGSQSTTMVDLPHQLIRLTITEADGGATSTLTITFVGKRSGI